jgi:hypothetical protein
MHNPSANIGEKYTRMKSSMARLKGENGVCKNLLLTAQIAIPT